MNDGDEGAGRSARSKRADARRNEQTLLDAAAAIFVRSGVEAPVRDIAAKAGVGMGTIYRHFPTRADLVIAVYRHQVEACAEAGPTLLATTASPHVALARWIDLFVDFLVTKHGLATALRPDSAQFDALHSYFLDRLVPVCTQLLDAAAGAGEIRSDLGAYQLMRGVGNLCIGADQDPRYDARRPVELLVAGLRREASRVPDVPDGPRAAGAPAHPATVRGLARDDDGRWLIVRPAGDDRWHLPGGLVEQNESPAEACRRELREELGVDLEPGPLYAAGWNPPLRPGRNARFTFVFDMGAHDAGELSPLIRLRAGELDSWRWARPDEALRVLHADIAERLTAARNGTPSAVYVEASELPADM